jgi:hypothetical protein
VDHFAGTQVAGLAEGGGDIELAVTGTVSCAPSASSCTSTCWVRSTRPDNVPASGTDWACSEPCWRGVGNPGGRCAEADEGAAEVRDQEADRARADQGGELVGDHVDGVGRGSGFDPLEQHAKISSRTIAIAHSVTIC